MTVLTMSLSLWIVVILFASPVAMMIALPRPDGRACVSGQFHCGDGRCVPEVWRCDGDRDCVDGRDEDACSPTIHAVVSAGTTPPPCEQGKFRCHDNMCIHMAWTCDGDTDCDDGSDEADCGSRTCAPHFTMCPGDTAECIPSRWWCDGEADCISQEDEQNCTTDAGLRQCRADEFRCVETGICIPQRWVCDGDDDCQGREDELSCTTTMSTATPTSTTPLTTTATPSTTTQSTAATAVTQRRLTGRCFYCRDSGSCIPEEWRCDRERDCGDNSDEAGCDTGSTTQPSTATPGQLNCASPSVACQDGSRCIQLAWVCDGDTDCDDRSDETPPCGPRCSAGEVACGGGSSQCIRATWRCDGEPDCWGGEDENNCDFS